MFLEYLENEIKVNPYCVRFSKSKTVVGIHFFNEFIWSKMFSLNQ